jgi:hypothetical protein
MRKPPKKPRRFNPNRGYYQRKPADYVDITGHDTDPYPVLRRLMRNFLTIADREALTPPMLKILCDSHDEIQNLLNGGTFDDTDWSEKQGVGAWEKHPQPKLKY